MLTVTTSKVLHGDPTKIIENSAWGEHPSGWKKYYCIRNRIYTYRKYGKNSFALYVSLFWMTRDDIWATLRSGQARAYNIRLSLCATFDGLLGILGKNAHFLPS
jgi:hypothetical protein